MKRLKDTTPPINTSIHNTIHGNYDSSRGELRLSEVVAGNQKFPHFQKVPDLFQNFCNELNQSLETIDASNFIEIHKRAFKAHYDLVSIHPFADGNGRLSRLIMNYIEQRFDQPLTIVFKEDKENYIKALQDTRKSDDMNVFYEFMFGELENSLQLAVNCQI